MAQIIQIRRGTAAQWTATNPLLAQGEMGVELDSLKWKVGNGSTPWSSLPYATGPAGPTGAPGTVGPFREGHTFAVLDDVTPVATLPSFFVPKHANQTVRLAGLRGKLLSGSVGLQIRRNGSNVGGVITLTSSVSYTSLGDVALADGDEIGAVLTAHASPTTLSATVVLEWSVP